MQYYYILYFYLYFIIKIIYLRMAKSLLLKAISDEVMDIIYDEQSSLNKIKKRHVSIEHTIIHLIKKTKLLEREVYELKILNENNRKI